MLDDPVIGRIRALGHDDVADHRIAGGTQAPIGDEGDRQLVALGDADVMVAGGTGFAPIKSMLQHLVHAGVRRPVHFYWGVRRPRDLYEGALVAGWAAAHDWLRFVPVMSEALPEDGWDGRRGWVHEAVLHDFPSLAAVDAYVAGPPPMIAVVQELFPAQGLPPGRLFFDSFEFAAR